MPHGAVGVTQAIPQRDSPADHRLRGGCLTTSWGWPPGIATTELISGQPLCGAARAETAEPG